MAFFILYFGHKWWHLKDSSVSSFQSGNFLNGMIVYNGVSVVADFKSETTKSEYCVTIQGVSSQKTCTMLVYIWRCRGLFLTKYNVNSVEGLNYTGLCKGSELLHGVLRIHKNVRWWNEGAVRGMLLVWKYALICRRECIFGKSEKLTRGSRSKYGKTGVCFVENWTPRSLHHRQSMVGAY